MKTICSTCRKIIEEGETIDGMVSHGTCEICASLQETAEEILYGEDLYGVEVIGVVEIDGKLVAGKLRFTITRNEIGRLFIDQKISGADAEKTLIERMRDE